MLLDFTVENFRSIKGAETLSAVAASKSKGKPSNSESRRQIKSDDEIAQPFHIEGWDIDVLPVIAIFGANASGKSNVLKALQYLLSFMNFGNDWERQSPLITFKLDSESREAPSRFALRTVFNRTIYTYSLVLDNSQIISEKLEYSLASTKRDRLLYSRTWNKVDKKFDWKNGSTFSGAHIQLEKELQQREPFISLFSKLEVDVVKPLIHWLMSRKVGIEWAHKKFDPRNLRLIVNPNQDKNNSDGWFQAEENAKKLLREFDTGLCDFEVIKSGNGSDDFQIIAFHETEKGEMISWKFEEESMGTQYLLSIAYNIQIMFLQGCLSMADELGSNLHPNITRKILRLFQSQKTNPNRAQLIFTSHDNTLQRNNLLRRDQIWFTQKRPDQSTELYSLSDFKVRNDLAIDKAYLDGRFGAVPFISDEDDSMPIGDDDG